MGGNPDAPAPARADAWVAGRIPVFVFALLALAALPSLLWLALQSFDWANSRSGDVLVVATLALAVVLLGPLIAAYGWAHGGQSSLGDAGDAMESAPDDLPDISQDHRSWWTDSLVWSLIGYLVLASLFGAGVDAAGLNHPPGDDDESSDAHAAAFARLLEATTHPDEVANALTDLDDTTLRAWCRATLPTLRALADDAFLHPADAELADLSAAWLRAEEHYLSRCVEGVFTLETARLPQELERRIQDHVPPPH